MFRIRIGWLGIAFLMTFPFSVLAQQEKEFRLIEVLSIGHSRDDLIFQWAGVTTDESENIYLTDLMDYSIKKFDKEGTLAAKAGEKGRGPGEFMAPTLIDYYAGKIFVTERSRPDIQIFAARDLQYCGRIPFPHPIVGLSVKSENEILISSFIPGQSTAVFAVDSTGRELYMNRIGKEEQLSFSDSMLDMAEFAVSENQDIILAFEWQDLILRTDRKGKLIWREKLHSGQKADLVTIAGFNVPERTVYKGIALDSLGNIFVLAGQFTPNPGKDIYVLNSHGKLIGTATLPESSHMIFIDQNNHLFARAGMGTILKKYEIRYSD